MLLNAHSGFGSGISGLAYGAYQAAAAVDADYLCFDTYELSGSGETGIVMAYRSSSITYVIGGKIIGRAVTWDAGGAVSLSEDSDKGLAIERVQQGATAAYFIVVGGFDAGNDVNAWPIKVEANAAVTVGTKTQVISGSTGFSMAGCAKMGRDYYAMLWGRDDNSTKAIGLLLNAGSPDTLTAKDEDDGTTNVADLPTFYREHRCVEISQDNIIGWNRDKVQRISYTYDTTTSIDTEASIASAGDQAYGVCKLDSTHVAMFYPSTDNATLYGRVITDDEDGTVTVGAEQTVDTSLSNLTSTAAVAKDSTDIYVAGQHNNAHYLWKIDRSGDTLSLRSVEQYYATDPNNDFNEWLGTAVRIDNNRLILPCRNGVTSFGVMIAQYV